jgi:hypothetical protein
VNFSNFVCPTGEEQDTLGSGGFTRINVGNDTNVSNSVELNAACVGHTV